MNTRSPREVLLAWVDTYNKRDPHALLALYHEDAQIIQVAFDAPVRGRDALLASFVEFFSAFPDNYTEIENLFEDGEWAIIEWSGGGTFTGELGGTAPTGKSFTLRGCGFFHVVAGRILFQRGYFDKQTWFSQIGMPIA